MARRIRVQAVVAALCVVAAACALPTPAAAVVSGIGDQRRDFLEDPRFAELGIERVRVVVPWDAVLTGDEQAIGWIDAALGRGLRPLVAFEKSRGVLCPGAGCQGPSAHSYRAAIEAFVARFPQVTELTPWNEPNHRSQPTYPSPGLATQYYNAARAACPDCLLVAGDLLDDANLSSWLASYRHGLVEQPAVWGIHNYYDATYFSSSGVDTLLANVPGDVWLTETGGIVRFTPPAGSGLAHDEMRAADSIRWLYSMTASRPRVARMYLYHWRADPANSFDAGLVGADGTARPGLAAVRDGIAAHSALAAGEPAGTGPTGQSTERHSATARPARVALSGKTLRLMRRGLRVGVSCIVAVNRCAGRVVITTPRGMDPIRPRLIMNFDLAPGQSLRRDLRVAPVVRELLRRNRTLQVTFCVAGTRACRTVRRELVTAASRG